MKYGCKKPATQRFYDALPVCLAGAQMKFVVSETWACDECWASFKLVVTPAEKLEGINYETLQP